MKKEYLMLAIFGLLLFFGCTQPAAPVADLEPPRDLEISFAGGSGYANTESVELHLYAEGASECRLGTDSESWGGWEQYAQSRQWTLGGGDGIKQVFYQCRNSEGELSAPVAATIILDRQAPELEIKSPLAGESYVDRFRLIFTATDQFAESLNCSAELDQKPISIGVVTSGRIQNISIRGLGGSHTLQLRCAGGTAVVERTVSFELVKSPAVELMIDGGSGYTDKRDVTLSMESPTASECRISNTKDEWGEWIAYSPTVSWELTGNDGTKSVYLQCRNAEGVVSESVSDSIVLDTSPPPYISITINNGDAWTNSRNVTLGIYAFAASECRYSNDGGTWSEWEKYKKKKTWMLSDVEGEKAVFLDCRKSNGEGIGSVSTGIRYSLAPTEPPSEMSIVIDGGYAYTESNLVSLTLNAVGAYQCRLREDGLEWTLWEDYSASKTFTLTDTTGAKTVHYQCRNDYGVSSAFSRIYLDMQAPEAPTNIGAKASPFSVFLYWSPAKDVGSGVRTYYIYRRDSDGSKVWAGITSSLNFKDERVIQGETYWYSIQAADMVGNFGVESSPLKVSVPE
ncbi:MAG: fibronectin type III domain-containing protein [Candidatus Micrarchaeota archaeon]